MNFFSDICCYDVDSHFLRPIFGSSKLRKIWIPPQYQDITTIAQHDFTVFLGCQSGAVVVVQMLSVTERLSKPTPSSSSEVHASQPVIKRFSVSLKKGKPATNVIQSRRVPWDVAAEIRVQF